MASSVANVALEEPYALIAHVRVCGGHPGASRVSTRRAGAGAGAEVQVQEEEGRVRLFQAGEGHHKILV